MSITYAKAQKNLSPMSVKYIRKFIFRTAVLCIILLVYFLFPEDFDSFFSHFFKKFTVLHLVWASVMVEMIVQAIPLKSMPTGCMKQFRFRYRPVKEGFSMRRPPADEDEQKLRAELTAFRRRRNLQSLVILAVWFLLNSFWWILRIRGIFTPAICMCGTVLYTVFDLICILVACPFQLFNGSKCCSGCPIFNYGQIFLCTPIMGIVSFPTISLIVTALIILLRWEYMFQTRTEMFSEKTNRCLQCAECTEKLCTTRNFTYRFFHIRRKNGHYVLDFKNKKNQGRK